jgi:hypothetical protein
MMPFSMTLVDSVCGCFDTFDDFFGVPFGVPFGFPGFPGLLDLLDFAVFCFFGEAERSAAVALFAPARVVGIAFPCGFFLALRIQTCFLNLDALFGFRIQLPFIEEAGVETLQ